MKRIASLVAAAALLPAIAAAETGFYAGAAAGFTRTELDLETAGLLPPSGDPLDSTNFSAGSFAFKAFGGYRFFDFLAVEAAYVDLGDAEVSACFVNSDGACAAEAGFPFPQIQNRGNPWTVEVPFQGFTLEVVGILPLGERWDIFGKVGAFFWEADITAFDEVEVAPGRPLPSPLPEDFPLIKTSIDGEDLTVGFGGSFHATEKFSVRAEFQWFDIPDTDAVWATTLSGIYRF